MACGGHVYKLIGSKLAIFIDNFLRMLPTKFWFIWPSCFREDFLEINQSEIRIACCGHVCKRIGTKLAFLIKDLLRMLPIKFRFIWTSDFRGEDFKISAIKNQELFMAAMFVNTSELNEQFASRIFQGCFLPSFDSFGEVVSEKKIFLEINQSEIRIVCGGQVC